jgi:mutator protein MutT
VIASCFSLCYWCNLGAHGEATELELIQVIAAVIERDGCMLVCQRPLHKRHGGLWEFPGGKLEPGESMLNAATREIFEELAMQVESAGDILYAAQDPGSQYLVNFVRVQATGDPIPSEHTDVRWLSAAQLLELRLAPSDEKFAHELNAQQDSRNL